MHIVVLENADILELIPRKIKKRVLLSESSPLPH
jgi:hypothetical protein